MRASRFDTEGCLISISRHETGSGGRGMTWRRRTAPRPGGPSRETSGAHGGAPEGPDGPVLARCQARRPRSGPRIGRQQLRRLNARLPGPSRSKPRNTARGTPWDLADLRLARRSSKERRRVYGLRQASMSRGVEARGSGRTLGVPRALGFYEAPEKWDYGLPGAAQRMRAMTLAHISGLILRSPPKL